MLDKILAFFEKNEKINLRYPWSWLGAFFWPAISALIMGSLALFAGESFQEAVWGPASYLDYIIVGTMIWEFVFVAFWQVSYSLRREQWELTLEGIILAPVSRVAHLVGNSLSGLFETSISALIIYGVAVTVFGFSIRGDLLLILLLLALTVFSVLGLGILVSSFTFLWKQSFAIAEIAMGLLMFISGVYYPVEILPELLRPISVLSPITYSLQAIRDVALTGAGFGQVSGSILILLVFSIITPLLGLRVFMLIEEYVRRKGTIGKY